MNYNNEKNQLINSEYKKVNRLTTLLCCIYFFLSFYENYLNSLIGSNTKYLLIVTIILIIINNKMFLFKWYHISMISWFILKLASLFWTMDYTIMREHILSQVGMLLLFVVMTTVRYDSKFVESILKTLIYTSSSMGGLALFFSGPYHGVVESRQVLVLFGIETDPNNMAAFYMVGVSIALYYIVFEKKNIYQNIFFVGINTYAIGLTGSRGGLITYLIVLIFIIIYPNEFSKNIKKQISKGMILLGIILSIFLVFKTFVPKDSFDRLFGVDGYNGGSDRDILWKNAYELFMKHPFLGAGWGSYFGYNNHFSAVHNTYLSMLSDVGIIGFSLFFIPVFWIFKKSIQMRIPLASIILITGLVPSIFLDAINKRFFWNAIIVAFVLINSKYDKK